MIKTRAISGKILHSFVSQVDKYRSFIISNVRVSTNLLMRRPSSPWLTQIVKTRTGSLLCETMETVTGHQDRCSRVFNKDFFPPRFTELNEDGSKKPEEEVKGMPSFWLTIFQVIY